MTRPRRERDHAPRSPHNRVDLAAALGTPVMAVAAGTVRLAEELFFAGNAVFVDHGDRPVSMYLQLDTIEFAQGDEVGRGQRLGTVGASGRVTGPHLHFGLRWRGARIDPRPLPANLDQVLMLR